jgi:hypothetical protein
VSAKAVSQQNKAEQGEADLGDHFGGHVDHG